MKHKGSWMAQVVALAVVAMVGVAAMAATDPMGALTTAPEFQQSAVFAANVEQGPGCQADVPFDLTLAQDESVPEPVVICLLLPECWRNSDCDAGCGAGLGRCVRGGCPARSCSCR